MMETLKINALILTAFVLTSPNIVSILTSLLFAFYIINMLYFNIIKPHYNGSWKKYIKSLWKI